jgi:hypothetical protein
MTHPRTHGQRREFPPFAMLGTLLDKLQSLFSKNFVIGSIPLYAFLFLHGLMAYRVSYYFQGWVRSYFLSQDTFRQAVLSFALLLIAVVVSYVLSTLSVFMRAIRSATTAASDSNHRPR